MYLPFGNNNNNNNTIDTMTIWQRRHYTSLAHWRWCSDMCMSTAVSRSARVCYVTDKTQESMKSCPFLNNQDLPKHIEWNVPQPAPQVLHLLRNLCLHKPAKYFTTPFDFRLLWRYVYDWAPNDTACCVIIVSCRAVVNVSLSCCLQCARCHLNQTLSAVSPSYINL